MKRKRITAKKIFSIFTPKLTPSEDEIYRLQSALDKFYLVWDDEPLEWWKPDEKITNHLLWSSAVDEVVKLTGEAVDCEESLSANSIKPEWDWDDEPLCPPPLDRIFIPIHH